MAGLKLGLGGHFPQGALEVFGEQDAGQRHRQKIRHGFRQIDGHGFVFQKGRQV